MDSVLSEQYIGVFHFDMVVSPHQNIQDAFMYSQLLFELIRTIYIDSNYSCNLKSVNISFLKFAYSDP